MIIRFTRRLCLFVLIVAASNGDAASVRLVDASLPETLATFSAITGDVYTSELSVSDKLTITRSNLDDHDEVRQLLTQLLLGVGLQLRMTSPGSYRVVSATEQPINGQLKTRIVRRLDIAGRIDRRGLEQLVAIDPRFDGLTVIPDGSKNQSVLVSGPSEVIDAIQKTLVQLPALAPSKPQGGVTDNISATIDSQQQARPGAKKFSVIDLRYADAGSVVEALVGVDQSLADEGQITAHSDNNQVIVIGSDTFVETVSLMVDVIDRQPRQVYIDAIVAEVSEQTTRQLGIQFSGRSGDLAIGLVSGTAGANLGTVVEDTLLAGVTGGLVALGGAATQFSDLGVLLTALKADGDTRILATPSLMAMENRDSEILVGQNVPFLTGQYTNTDGGTAASPFQTIEREDLGTILRFKPRVGRDGTLMLDVTQEVSRLDTSTSGLSDVATIKRQLSTVVSANSGETIVIGGLRDEQLESTESKIPGLGDIPVVGHLFRQESVRTISRNLVIFLRPTLVSEDTQRIQVLNRWDDRVRASLNSDADGVNRVFRSPPVLQKMPDVLTDPNLGQSQESR